MPTDPLRPSFTDEEVFAHIGEIMFTPTESPDPDCLMCQCGVDLGAWARYGVEDPFGRPQ